LLDSGKIKPEDAGADHPDRSRLINCLGADMYPAVDHTGPFLLQEQDTLLLCTDGLWGTVSDTEIFSMLSHPDLSQCLPALVQHASQLGGQHADDATGLAVRWLTETSVETTIDSSTLGGQEFESTVHLTLGQDTDIRVMSDAEIDATIAEINQTLDKINKTKK
jgi:serine/threonine protein phosphatase PrpC